VGLHHLLKPLDLLAQLIERSLKRREALLMPLVGIIQLFPNFRELFTYR
jgi:hypothetical protein